MKKIKKIKPHFEEITMWALIKQAERHIAGKDPKFLKQHIKDWKQVRRKRALKKAAPEFYRWLMAFERRCKTATSMVCFKNPWTKKVHVFYPQRGAPSLDIGNPPVSVNIHLGNIDLDNMLSPYRIR